MDHMHAPALQMVVVITGSYHVTNEVQTRLKSSPELYKGLNTTIKYLSINLNKENPIV